MENKDSKSLFDIQKSDLHSLQTQGFQNICTVKRRDALTDSIIPSGFTITYWWDCDMISINLLLEDSGKYTLKIRGVTLRTHVPIDKVKSTLDKYSVKIQKQKPFVVIERLKARRRK